jgi:hypothetical protein
VSSGRPATSPGAIDGGLDHPKLELVGCWVDSAAKDGVDVGTLVGRQWVGVAAITGAEVGSRRYARRGSRGPESDGEGPGSCFAEHSPSCLRAKVRMMGYFGRTLLVVQVPVWASGV